MRKRLYRDVITWAKNNIREKTKQRKNIIGEKTIYGRDYIERGTKQGGEQKNR